MSSRMYPEGSGGLHSKFIAGGIEVFYNSAGTEIYRIDPLVTGAFVIPSAVRMVRKRCTIAEVNAGVSLLALLTGFKVRMVTASAIAIGGTVGTLTTVDILATQGASSVKLVAFAQASLTRSTVLTAGGSGAAVLADGASFVANDVSTAITVGKTGGTGDTATHVDVLFTYVLEA